MFPFIYLLTGLLAVSVAIIGVASAPAANYFWSNWSDGKPKLTVKNGAEGKFDVTWSGDKGNFVIGKGWNPGSSKNVTYTSTFSPTAGGNAYLAIYGWTTSPLVEYYIIEAHGDHHPSDNPEAKILGNVTSDGGTYQIMTKKRYHWDCHVCPVLEY
ncbi:hypothetical protein N0V85_003764 [Neurospora sp. IMI 360204]|nr:hypothetical protein N0V85_003764 [Neurospora sp. IMI 360204]